MNAVLSEILLTKTVRSACGCETLPLHSAMSPEEGEFLQRLVVDVKPILSVEVGLAYGISALYLCDAIADVNPAARHVVIDPYQTAPGGWRGIGLKNLDRAGFGPMVELIEKPSHLAFPEIALRGIPVDFALIDGWHTFDHTLVDFFLIDRLLRVGGVIAIDDADMLPVRKALRYIVTNRSYTVVGSLANPHRPSLKRRAALLLGRHWPLRRLTKPEWRQSDESLGLFGSCIALRKNSDDDRNWDSHREF